VTFVYAEKDDVLREPNAALRFRPPPSLLASSNSKGGPPGRPVANGTGPGSPGGGRAGGAASRPGAAPADRRTIWTLEGELPEAERIRVGISDGTFTEVVEGDVKAGDVVVTDVSGGPPSGVAAGLRRGL
jgi:HlyD family secretion protein